MKHISRVMRIRIPDVRLCLVVWSSHGSKNKKFIGGNT